MRKAKAIAIAIPQESAFDSAIRSAKETAALLIDFMYGSQDRLRITYTLALALFILGISMSMAGAGQACSYDALPANF